MTPEYFENHVRHIADADVLAAVGFDSFEQWARHWAAVAPRRARFVDRDMFLGTRDGGIRGQDSICRRTCAESNPVPFDFPRGRLRDGSVDRREFDP